MDIQEDDEEKIYYLLDQLEPTITNGNLEEFKALIQTMHEVQNKTLLNLCYNNRGIDLISLICKRNKKKFLRYLLYQSHILQYLSNDDKSKEMKCKETAFYWAIFSKNFEILEILYDYWSGDLHWVGHNKELIEFDIAKLSQLYDLLDNAFNEYDKHIRKVKEANRTMMYTVQSLMALNGFQKEIYRKLNELRAKLIMWEDEPKDIIRIQETYAIQSMIIAMIDIYEKYSQIEFHETFYFLFCDQNDQTENILGAFDETVEGYLERVTDTLKLKTYFCLTREVYYRKLDYNICLLILDNLYMLKLRLSMPKDAYQNLENKLYHFCYHVKNKWSMYIPKRKKMKVCNTLGKYKDVPCNFKLNYDANKWDSFPYIIYFERTEFEKSLHTFKEELKNINVEENIRKEKDKLSTDDYNYLMSVPELRDDYSLNMMSRIIGQLYSTAVNTEYEALLVVRTLQIVGEFLKSANESIHLEPSTEALLKAEISVEVINKLKKLRDLLCHAKKCTLLKRNELERNEHNIFLTVRGELLYIKTKIDNVINIHKPLVQRALLRSTESALCEKRNEMPGVFAQVILYVLNLLQHIPNRCLSFLERIWKSFGYFRSIFNEFIVIVASFIILFTERLQLKKSIRNKVICKFNFYRQKIEYSLKEITDYKTKWQQIIKEIKDKDPSANFLNYPNEDDANRIRSYSKKFDLGHDTLILLNADNAFFATIQYHWKFILDLLEFIVIKTNVLSNKDAQIRNRLKELKDYDYKTNDVEKIIVEYLDQLEKRLEIKNKVKTNTDQPGVPHTITKHFSGIKELTCKLSESNFLTEEEKTYLSETLRSINSGVNVKKRKKIETMMENIKKDVSIPKKNYENFKDTVGLNKKSQKILMNLVKGCERDPLIVYCLSNKVSMLKIISNGQTASQLVLRYKLDKTFRTLFEVVLFDIFDILQGNNRNSVIVKKLSKLLTEINLRNILIHLNPLMEVVGAELDPNDLSTELVTKAMDFIEDEPSIKALCALSDSGFFSQLNNTAVSPEQQTWMIEFKTSPRWKDYIRLIPKYKQNLHEEQKKIPADVRKSTLADAEDFDESNVNFIDDHNKAPIHYAAIKCDVLLLDILVNKGADVNIPNTENNLTALHYAAMHNSKDAVEFLLQNEANCLALDNKGRTPVYLASQRKFLDISQLLKREMKKS